MWWGREADFDRWSIQPAVAGDELSRAFGHM